MTNRTYKYGKYTCKAYKKAAGKGWEIGFSFAGHEVFVGNFIHTAEANAWWTMMNREVGKFCRKYAAAPNASTTWTSKFMSNYFYKCYYNFLNSKFTKYQRGFTQAVKKDERRYTAFKKTHPHAQPMSFRKAA